MAHLNLKSMFTAGVLTLGLGPATAAPLKILLINTSGPAAFVRTEAINWMNKYITQVLGPQEGWTVVSSGDAVAGVLSSDMQAKFNDDSLAAYNVVVFNNTASIGGAIPDPGERLAFEKWVRTGGGVVAWHGFLDHGDLWPFITDSLLGGTKFTDHSSFNSTGGKNAKVFWDTTRTGDTVQSLRPEYAAIKAGFDDGLAKQGSPDGRLTYPDEWYSFRINPRLASPSDIWGGYSRVPDILYSIDEDTYDVPSAAKMGKDHPLAWAYKLPPLFPGGFQGRFIYTARGHAIGSFDGKSVGAAPNGSDSSDQGLSKTFVRESIRWAAAGKVTSAVRANALTPSLLAAQGHNGVLNVQVNGGRNYEILVYTTLGRIVGRRTGSGFAEYTFPGLARGNLYGVTVKSAGQTFTQRVML